MARPRGLAGFNINMPQGTGGFRINAPPGYDLGTGRKPRYEYVKVPDTENWGGGEAKFKYIRREVGARTSRPRPFLTVAATLLSAPSNALIGFIHGVNKYKRDHGDFNKPAGEYLVTEPWEFFKSIGAGFREIPDAVVENEGPEVIAGGIQARYGTESFLGRHAGTIGFTTALVTDPTLYLSFGATAPSRIAAKRLMDLASESSLAEARAIMAKGGVVDGRRFGTVQQAYAYSHAKNGRPFTMGDALDQMNTQIKANRTSRVGMSLRPAKGGRGVRFAGREIPGTVPMGEYMAKALRGKSEELYRTKNYQLLLNGIPNSALHFVGNDLLRANLGSKFTDFRRAHEVITDRVAEDAITHVLKPLTDIVNEPVMSAGSRQGLHRLRPQEVTEPALKVMRQRIEQVRVRSTNAGTRAGLSAADLDNVWDDLAEKFDDPLDAVAHFAVKASARTSFASFKKAILEDPRFAREITGRPQVKGAPIGITGAEGAKRLMGEVPITMGKRKFLVPDEVSSALEELKNTALQDVELGRFLRALNWPQNKWKTFATVMNPAFFTMNLVGAVFNNMLAAVVNPIDYTAAVAAVVKDRLGATPETMLEAQARGVGGLQSFVSVEAAPKKDLLTQFGEEQRSLGKAVSEQQVGGLVERAGAIVNPAKRQLGVSRKRQAVRRGRQVAGVGLAATGNPLAIAAFGPEIANIGRSVNSAIEDVVRLAPFMKMARDKELRQLVEAYGPVNVPGMHHPGLSKQQQKTLYDIGADLSNHFQFDYRELTEFERRFAKSVFPFYTFFKKNFKLQAEQLVQQPRNLAAWDAFTTYMNEEMDTSLPEDFRAILPEYFDQLEAFQIPMPGFARKKLGMPENEPLYLNPKLPFITLNMFPPFWDAFQETGEPFPTKMMKATGFSTAAGMTGPLAGWGVKTMIEYFTNQQLGLARPIDFQRANSNDWRQSYRDAPGWVKYLPDTMQDWLGVTTTPSGKKIMTNSRIYVIEQLSTPFINNLGQSLAPEGATEHQRAQAKADMVSWMTGLRLMPVDLLKLHRSWGYRMIDMLEAQQQELKDQGKTMDPEDQASLRLLRREVKVLERAWDRREDELYGSP